MNSDRWFTATLWLIPLSFLAWPFIIFDLSETTEVDRQPIRVEQVVRDGEGGATTWYVTANGQRGAVSGAQRGNVLVTYRGRLGWMHQRIR